MKVKIYTAPFCHFCHMAKAYLDKKGVRYEEFNVQANRRAAKEMMAKSGQDAVPVLEIEGKIVVGFDEKRIEEALTP